MAGVRFTRRALLGAAVAFGQEQVVLPVYLVTDTRAKIAPEEMDGFSKKIWPEAVQDFLRAGIRIDAGRGMGEVRRTPSGRPVFAGLARGAINLVLTDRVPLLWDQGRGLAGVAARWDGYDLCVVAAGRAHGHLFPFVLVNTCVHELLHVLLRDIVEARPKGAEGSGREFLIDWYATRLWLFGDGRHIRELAAKYRP